MGHKRPDVRRKPSERYQLSTSYGYTSLGQLLLIQAYVNILILTAVTLYSSLWFRCLNRMKGVKRPHIHSTEAMYRIGFRLAETSISWVGKPWLLQDPNAKGQQWSKRCSDIPWKYNGESEIESEANKRRSTTLFVSWMKTLLVESHYEHDE